MRLVEVVRPITASDDTIKTAMAFATACGKDAIEVVDRAGFVVNALLFPYLNNAVRMLEQGTASREYIDTAMQGGCNFPMGPLALLDLVGLDTAVSILDSLYDEFRDANYATVPTLRRMVAAGQLGRKTKRGFYEYWRSRDADRAAADALATARREIADADGIVAIGGDLEPGTLLAAYRRGLFPMPYGSGARLVLPRTTGDHPDRRPAGQPLAAAELSPLRGPSSTPGSPR